MDGLIGAIFFDRDFKFQDGASGEKFFVVLGVSGTAYIVVKTTSQIHGRGITYGCQIDDRFPNFHLPKNSCWFDKPTYVCLDEFYELSAVEFLQKNAIGQLYRAATLLQIEELQTCALLSLDLSSYQKEIIQGSIG